MCNFVTSFDQVVRMMLTATFKTKLKQLISFQYNNLKLLRFENSNKMFWICREEGYAAINKKYFTLIDID